jgi:hypothetical protein
MLLVCQSDRGQSKKYLAHYNKVYFASDTISNTQLALLGF